MSKTICYYHKADLDGKCSAAIIRRKFPECELIGVDYPDRPDFEKIESGDTVFVVDYSFPVVDMMRLLDDFKDNLIWIDHHKSAIDSFGGMDCLFVGKREIGKGACELTWEYLFPDEPMPDAVKLLGRYDVWDHSNEDVLFFQDGMWQQGEWKPSHPVWQTLFDSKIEPIPVNYVTQVIGIGKTIAPFRYIQDRLYAKKMAFKVEFEGYDAWAINKALSNSKIFDGLDPYGERPLYILFNYKGGVWKYSLYSNPNSGIDVSKIAVKYGGGGHAVAAGFQSEKYLLNNQ
jgi:oligoribonuclease NrnB/cAMP/cGMP phosphodiesterase (DHH superfamily)